MKKFGLLVMPLMVVSLLASCSNTKNMDIRYQEITDEGRAAIEFVKSLGYKETLQYGDKWECVWSEALNRQQDFLDTSYQEQLNIAADKTKEIFNKHEPIISDGYKTYFIEPDSGKYERVILYLHGGAYLNNITYFQLDSCYAIANKFNARIYVPIYPLVPQHTYQDCYAFLNNLYGDITLREEDKDIVFMGDSAGGGLVLSYSEYLIREKKSVKLPIARICFSPWCDLSMSNPDIASKLEEEVFLAPFGLGVIGNYWAANTTITNYKLSPFYGNLNDKIDTIFFVGSAEIFLSDITKTFQKLTNNGCRTRLIIGKELFHTYPMLSTLPESKAAYDMAYDFVVNHK